MALTFNFKPKHFNDPIYGFISVRDSLILEIIDHSFFQRLRRIYQMGLSYLIYPGTHHTRFEHAMGSMYLMQKTIDILRKKNIVITEQEEQGLLIAILLHDIGHGPFSHTLESLIIDTSHEDISMMFIKQLNIIFKGQLNTAIEILNNTYEKPFFYQLICGQIDLDRLDYLKRDSFYAGVPEGNIHQERIISMMNVYKGNLVFEDKAVYPIESFLFARRFMYWQVYYHKVNLLIEHLLCNVLKRAKQLLSEGRLTIQNEYLSFFLKGHILDQKGNEAITAFSNLDDIDIYSNIKSWQYHNDKVLSMLSDMLINRKLPKIIMSDDPPHQKTIDTLKRLTMKTLSISEEESNYFVFTDKVEGLTYNKDKNRIQILSPSKGLVDITAFTNIFKLEIFIKPSVKYYLCHIKNN